MNASVAAAVGRGTLAVLVAGVMGAGTSVAQEAVPLHTRNLSPQGGRARRPAQRVQFHGRHRKTTIGWRTRVRRSSFSTGRAGEPASPTGAGSAGARRPGRLAGSGRRATPDRRRRQAHRERGHRRLGQRLQAARGQVRGQPCGHLLGCGVAALIGEPDVFAPVTSTGSCSGCSAAAGGRCRSSGLRCSSTCTAASMTAASMRGARIPPRQRGRLAGPR